MDFLQISAVLLFLQLQSAILFVSLIFLFISFLFTLTCSPVSCMCTVMAEDLLLPNRCTMTALEEGRWFGPVSHTCLLYPPCAGYSSLLLFCFSWSVFHKLCKLSRQGDRQPVQVFFSNRQESQESHWCSGHVRRSTADTLPAFPSPASSSHLMWSSLIHLPPNCFSSLLALLESWGAHKISLAALEDFSQCWFPKNSAGSSRANSSACYHINSSFMSSVWIIHMYRETKGSFMIPWVYSSPCWSWQTYCFSLLITHQYAVV